MSGFVLPYILAHEALDEPRLGASGNLGARYTRPAHHSAPTTHTVNASANQTRSKPQRAPSSARARHTCPQHTRGGGDWNSARPLGSAVHRIAGARKPRAAWPGRAPSANMGGESAWAGVGGGGGCAACAAARRCGSEQPSARINGLAAQARATTLVPALHRSPPPPSPFPARTWSPGCRWR